MQLKVARVLTFLVGESTFSWLGMVTSSRANMAAATVLGT